MSALADPVLFAVVAVAAVTDLRTQRIPNWLTLPAAVFGFCLHFSIAGASGLLASVLGWITGLAILLGFHLVGGMGAGDVKLMAACGALAGASRVVWIAIYSGLAGGVYALCIVVYSMVLRAGFSGAAERVRSEAASLLVSGGGLRTAEETLRSYPKLRYAVAVAFGVGAEALFGTP